MSAFSDSYVSRVLLATPTPMRGLDLAARRWRWLRIALFDPYRPELHYMRGPGLKWRAKHERALRIDPGVLSLTPVWARPSPRLVSDKRFP
jgi:hypothetical protein